MLVKDEKRAETLIAETVTSATEDLRLQNQEVLARVAWDPRLHDPHLVKWLHRVSAPTHVIAGDSDSLFPVPYAKAWTDEIKGAKATLLSACGHFPQYEKPQELANAILGFLAQHGA